ncbi:MULTISPECIES: hypothetical protein [Rhodopseudomonas]|uniref:Uncharacterized protein n=1 Tax=Rhodopseudomonas palustris TaxID=1076 RepID=A0A0D7EDW0_RHOPL|nr:MULTISPECIES: hypothetical protein [Rhodopseudomonas]KIZ38816.1 hypothetical protein OO17_22520 [Rhodopseudomonas palustris]MDF3810892.1 hypothetical protein [Rhodopseudomonas sp. BAL398]WOK18255.1 hypothetical protein RBJ75_01620 [Rhodopseudomonas sp. BAL398]
MATATSTAHPPANNEQQQARPRVSQEIREFWRLFFVAAFNPYRPEQHYMRGPGPAWHAKHDGVGKRKRQP